MSQAQTITAPPASGTITGCAGSPSASPNLQQITVTSSGLSSAITATAPVNFEISLASAGAYSKTISLPQTGGTVYVRSAAIAPVGSLSDNVSFTSAGAGVFNVPVSATIKALPVVNAIADQTVTSGALTTPVNFTGTAPVYQWTNSNPGIGIAASGYGNIPAFTTINPGTNSETATFTVTPSPNGFIFTGNANSNSVSMVNSNNNTVVATIPVGNGPYVTLVNPNQREVYVSCFYHNEVDVLDALTGSIISKIAVGNNPEHMTTSPSGSMLYVVNGGGASVSVINTATHVVVATIPVGATPQILTMSPDGSKLFVSTYGTFGEGPIYVINTATNAVTGTITAGMAVRALVISPDGNRLYVSNGGIQNLVVINVITNNVIAAISVGNYPLDPVLNADGSRLYIANMLSNDVSVINTATNTVIATIAVGNYAFDCALSADEKFLYVVNRESQSVSIISTASNTVIKTISLSGQLDYPVLSPDGTRLYITDDGSNVIHVINTETNTLITDVPVGLNPLMSSKSISIGNGCSGAPKTFKITVNKALPVITAPGNINAVNTTYGIPSTAESFTVSGTNLSAGITVTPPPGFEVSTDNVNFSSTVTVGGANIAGPITVYIRLAAKTNAGVYSGNIVLSSSGATNIDINIPSSTVSPSILNITGTYGKYYGDELTDYTLTANTPGVTFNPVGLRNNDAFKSIKIAFGNGANPTAQVGTYPGTVTLSDFQGDNGYLPGNYIIHYFPVDLAVLPAPITITANNINKPYGTALSDGSSSTGFSVTGLKNNETIGTVYMLYGLGAPAPASPGVYTGSVVPSAAAGGSFSPANYTISYQAGNLTINAPPPPILTYRDIPSTLQTIYGTPSIVTSIRILGQNLTSGVSINPPAGFELSTDNSSFGGAIALTPDAGGNLAITTIYIRLAATTPVGNYAGNLALSNAGAGNINIPLAGTVTPAPLTVTAKPVVKTYGDSPDNGAASTAFTASGLQNEETIGTVTLSYGAGSATDDAVGVYNPSIIPSAAAGGSFNSNNYNIAYIPAGITVNPAPLTITADNISRAIANENPILTLKYTGFVNNEGPAQLTTLPQASTTAVLTSPAGQYPIVVSGAFSANYIISYVPGSLTIYSAPQNIKVPNTFTPNGDGVNDLWVIKDLQYYPGCAVDIYNRYGLQLYHSRGYSQAWDGTYHNQPLPFGTYYYIVNLNDGSQARLSGYVTIVR
ncbi:MBG domain-containing protein [Mucilaginibacter sp.]|uniref:MBG domain-containing protein n=1 Tax=Mucilaginibacter sp. TaxID=1882438 RepID=UPI002ED5DE30